jgi:hypothetical protein
VDGVVAVAHGMLAHGMLARCAGEVCWRGVLARCAGEVCWRGVLARRAGEACYSRGLTLEAAGASHQLVKVSAHIIGITLVWLRTRAPQKYRATC